MDNRHEIKLTIFPVFADSRYDPTDYHYFKILLNEDGSIISESLTKMDKSIDDAIVKKYNNLVNIDFDFAKNKLVHLRKLDYKTVELIYVIENLYFSNCTKGGEIVYFKDLISLENMDQLYVKTLSEHEPRHYSRGTIYS